MAELPIACTLTPEALRTRREGLLMDLVRRAERREDLDDGLRLEFAPSAETIGLIARAVEAERHCCRFLRFSITVELAKRSGSRSLAESGVKRREDCRRKAKRTVRISGRLSSQIRRATSPTTR